ncbi:hypothetical protein [Crocosphaera sp. XPORK-15E]|uniref:hypothetical protein n=1 Tax=Crocosphaera sp. XPORK-15E TaxID=3110247 RepID=UPI002B20DE82|nr:hypothetical protein [Crocosphaera sp. XPORK-15E]MEA5536969.1 hypothetical protein [Crocosphaera sp. XPORK-15E]
MNPIEVTLKMLNENVLKCIKQVGILLPDFYNPYPLGTHKLTKEKSLKGRIDNSYGQLLGKTKQEKRVYNFKKAKVMQRKVKI